ncbi:geranylgeranylglyceryl/heptaprenylglyceryl phosphate synthase [Marinilabiliaceae bacterium ANBcel2]|nr:geranylgeranylglyceryl/heptaprenylglyceryl phosphate synthase [Marinilabiliaceae bacterium ANBcel2]
MMDLYFNIKERVLKGEKIFVLLIDPDKCKDDVLNKYLKIIKERPPHIIMVGGSLISTPVKPLIEVLKKESDVPVVLYPGSPSHLVDNVDAILFLSLISGRNPDLLIGSHVVAAPYIKRNNIEPLSTGYMLIDGGVTTSVEYISQTKPIPSNKPDIAVATAMAGEMLGMDLIYMDCGSGAQKSVPLKMIERVKASIDIPLMIGGGVRTPETLNNIFSSGADMAIVGNALENDLNLYHELLDVAEKWRK